MKKLLCSLMLLCGLPLLAADSTIGNLGPITTVPDAYRMPWENPGVVDNYITFANLTNQVLAGYASQTYAVAAATAATNAVGIIQIVTNSNPLAVGITGNAATATSATNVVSGGTVTTGTLIANGTGTTNRLTFDANGLTLSNNLPVANQVLFRVQTSDDASRFSIDEDGDVSMDGNFIANDITSSDMFIGNSSRYALYGLANSTMRVSGSSGDDTLTNIVFGTTSGPTNAAIRIYGGTRIAPYTTPTIEFVSVTKSAEDVIVGGTLTATNGVYVGCPTNVMNGIDGYPTATTNVPVKITPVGLFGYMGFQGSQAINVITDGVYVNIVSNGVAYNRVLTNGFNYGAVGGFLTNTVAGYYGVTIGATGAGDAGVLNKEYELELFVNGIAEEYFASSCTASGASTFYRFNTSGTLYLAANSALELRIKEIGTSNNDPTLTRYFLKVGTP